MRRGGAGDRLFLFVIACAWAFWSRVPLRGVGVYGKMRGHVWGLYRRLCGALSGSWGWALGWVGFPGGVRKPRHSPDLGKLFWKVDQNLKPGFISYQEVFFFFGIVYCGWPRFWPPYQYRCSLAAPVPVDVVVVVVAASPALLL